MTEDQPQAAMRSVPERIEHWLRTRAMSHRTLVEAPIFDFARDD